MLSFITLNDALAGKSGWIKNPIDQQTHVWICQEEDYFDSKIPRHLLSNAKTKIDELKANNKDAKGTLPESFSIIASDLSFEHDDMAIICLKDKLKPEDDFQAFELSFDLFKQLVRTSIDFKEFIKEDICFGNAFFQGVENTSLQLIEKLEQLAVEDISALCISYITKGNINKNNLAKLLKSKQDRLKDEKITVCDGELVDITLMDHIYIYNWYEDLLKHPLDYQSLSFDQIIPKIAKLNHKLRVEQTR